MGEQKQFLLPWHSSPGWGAIALVGGLFYVWLGVSKHLGVLILAGWIAVAAGLIILLRSRKRLHGIRVEKKAIKGLRLPTGWNVEANVLIEGLGDVDLLITNPEGEKFVVEIKSHASVSKKGGLLFKEELVRGDGKRFVKDPVEQVLSISERLVAKPILWFPEAQVNRFNLKCGVVVVCGPPRKLKAAIGAGWLGWLW